MLITRQRKEGFPSLMEVVVQDGRNWPTARSSPGSGQTRDSETVFFALMSPQSGPFLDVVVAVVFVRSHEMEVSFISIVKNLFYVHYFSTLLLAPFFLHDCPWRSTLFSLFLLAGSK